MAKSKLPSLPDLLKRKIYKTGQTRGAENDEIFQNRVSRNSTVLIRYDYWEGKIRKLAQNGFFEKGFIVLISPDDYFIRPDRDTYFKRKDLIIGENFLVFYQTRKEWNEHNPTSLGWKPAENRQKPLGGNYVARVPALTSKKDGEAIFHGFAGKTKGAGIRLYEYANEDTIKSCALQLEAIFWLCNDSVKIATQNGMSEEDANKRKQNIIKQAKDKSLLDFRKLRKKRILNDNNETICPLCLKNITGSSFFNKVSQAEGRSVPDLTVTDISLFHIHELRYTEFNHCTYNLGWGHYFCNVVAKDEGIEKTLDWMLSVLKNNNMA